MSYVDRLMSEGESQVFTTRHHWFLLVGAGWGLMLLLLVGIVVQAYGNLNFSALLVQLNATSDQLTVALVVLGLVLIAYPLIALTVIYIRRQFDQVIVTNYRVLHVEGVFSKRVMDSSLEKVNDVLLSQSFIGRLFDYGNVQILTASEVGVNALKWIAKPVAFKRAMIEAKQELEGGGKFRASIPELIAQLAELRDRGAISEEEFQTEKTQLLGKL